MNFLLTTSFIVLTSIYLYGQDGTLDDAFIPENVLNSSVICSAIQEDGKILVGGWFDNSLGSGLNRIARFNSDGSLDNTFITGSGFNSLSGDLTAPTVRSISIQEDGKIIVGGGFSTYNNDSTQSITRLNSDGSLDETFQNKSVFGTVHATAIQNDGKIIVGGNFLDTINSKRNHITRLNSDGSVDETFTPIIGFDTKPDNVMSITLQLDGKIIIGGNFSEYDGVSRNKIVRLNSNGSIDTSFNPGTGFNSIVYSTALQEDGKILVGGRFFIFNGIVTNYITRLNSDGSIDESFNVGVNIGFDKRVNCIKIQSDNKIIVGGSFSEYSGEDIEAVARLNVDGTLDKAFDSGAKWDVSVRSISFQSDGRIIIAGEFYHFNLDGVVRNRIARLNTNILSVHDENLENLIHVFPNPTSDKAELQIPNKLKGGKLVISNAKGQIIDQSEMKESSKVIDFENHDKGIYFIRINTQKGIITRRVVKQ